jgi:hypothetical protein
MRESLRGVPAGMVKGFMPLVCFLKSLRDISWTGRPVLGSSRKQRCVIDWLLELRYSIKPALMLASVVETTTS